MISTLAIIEPSSALSGTFSHLRRRKREKAKISNSVACYYRLRPRLFAWEKVPKGDEGSLVGTDEISQGELNV
jgi:hypothetical protein